MSDQSLGPGSCEGPIGLGRFRHQVICSTAGSLGVASFWGRGAEESDVADNIEVLELNNLGL